SPPRPQLLVDANRELVRVGRQIPLSNVIAFGNAGVRRRPVALTERQLCDSRKTRLWNGVGGKGLTRDGIDDRAGESAGQFFRERNAKKVLRADFPPQTFVVHEKEGLVPSTVRSRHPDRTADDEPGLLLIELLLLNVEEAPRVELVVSQEREHRPAQTVCTRLADDVDLVGAEAVLGRVRRRLFLELLNGIHRKDYRGRPEGRVGV